MFIYGKDTYSVVWISSMNLGELAQLLGGVAALAVKLLDLLREASLTGHNAIDHRIRVSFLRAATTGELLVLFVGEHGWGLHFLAIAAFVAVTMSELLSYCFAVNVHTDHEASLLLSLEPSSRV